MDIGLLILRLWFGLEMAFAHGWGKVLKVIAGDFQWADPIGLGSTTSLILASGAEFVCAIFIALGFFTRLNLIPYLITMLVAAFIVHWGDPWAKQVNALHYAIPAIVLLITGPGRYSLDHQLFVRKQG